MTKPTMETTNLVSPAPLILIVDDQIDNIQVLAVFLETQGYSVTYALNGTEAIQRLSSIQPDLILLDLFMPDINGFQVCEQVRANPDYQDIPILFVTASHEEEHVVTAFEKGAADYVMKPFESKEVLARIATHIKLRRQTIELKHARQKLESIVTNVKDGILVIDQLGIIRFANPSAANMFNQPLEKLLGYPLGTPVVEKHLTQIDILRLNGDVGLAEITIAEAEWDFNPAWFMCLRDISDRYDIHGKSSAGSGDPLNSFTFALPHTEESTGFH